MRLIVSPNFFACCSLADFSSILISFNIRNVIVACCISATIYYGGTCTQKYFSNPVTFSSEMVSISELPPLKWSICKQVKFSDLKCSPKVIDDNVTSEGIYIIIVNTVLVHLTQAINYMGLCNFLIWCNNFI